MKADCLPAEASRLVCAPPVQPWVGTSTKVSVPTFRDLWWPDRGGDGGWGMERTPFSSSVPFSPGLGIEDAHPEWSRPWTVELHSQGKSQRPDGKLQNVRSQTLKETSVHGWKYKPQLLPFWVDSLVPPPLLTGPLSLSDSLIFSPCTHPSPPTLGRSQALRMLGAES